ncbi:MAG: hypothetical protein ABR540_05385, partial [Acidimicrobiales bacterium]
MVGGAERATVEVALDPEGVTAGPLELASWTVRVRNQGTAVARCRLAVVGDVSAWAWLTPAELTVEPEGEQVAQLNVRLPPPPRPVAGPSSFVVAVHVEGAAEPVTVPGTLDVAPVVDLAASLGAE